MELMGTSTKIIDLQIKSKRRETQTNQTRNNVKEDNQIVSYAGNELSLETIVSYYSNFYRIYNSMPKQQQRKYKLLQYEI